MRHLLLFLSITLIGLSTTAQIVISGPGNHTQDFNTLPPSGSATWTNNTTIPGWYTQRTGTGTTIVANDGSNNAGNLYSYGAPTVAERALGTLGSGNAAVGSFAYGVAFQNTSGGAISNFQLGYTLEQWRNSAAAAQSITFWYKVMSVFSSDLTPIDNTGWTEVTALMGTSPITGGTASPLVGNDAANKVVIAPTAISGLTLANGEYVIFRWVDPDHVPGADHGLAIDDVTVSWGTTCNTVNTINVAACGSYMVPSGDETHFTSGVYTDTIPNAALCDSIITINLTIYNATTSTISPVACGSYIVPSGDETHFASGTYMDTIPNAHGCDSVITINLTIVTSLTYYLDDDGDGLGDPDVSQDACAQPTDYVLNDDDCDDSDENIGIATVTYYTDSDNDGFGEPGTGVVECIQPAGTVTNDDDCDDSDDQIGAGQTYYLDNDNDGYGTATSVVDCSLPTGYAAQTGDCDDNNNAVHPGATEIADNGIDEDCIGGDLSTALGIYQFADTAVCPVAAIDVDVQPANATFNSFNSVGTTCTPAANVFNNSGWNTTGTIDLTEYNTFTIKPADCYELNLTSLSFLHRTSGTGGNPTVTVRSSLDNFTTDVFTATIAVANTNENVMNALPAAFTNITDSVTFRFYITNIGQAGSTYRMDNVKLNGSIDALPMQTYYADEDNDGFGDAASSVSDCEHPLGYVIDNTDCNDNNAEEFPGAVWYADLDGDGFGDADNTLTQCLQPTDYVSDSTDCDDTDEDILGALTYYIDADGDGFGENGSVGVVACEAPNDHVLNDDDCDDNNNAIHPNAVEICDGFDNNCNGQEDEGLTMQTWYSDSDGDTFGDPDMSIMHCDQPAGYVLDNTDCDDTDENINPDATEITGNTIDENCDGLDGNVGLGEETMGVASVFPNPGTTEVTIELSGSWNGTIAAAVVSADGKEVLSRQFETAEMTLPVQQLVPGIYMIRVTDGTKTAIVRWVKN